MLVLVTYNYNYNKDDINTFNVPTQMISSQGKDNDIEKKSVTFNDNVEEIPYRSISSLYNSLLSYNRQCVTLD